jgi:hypothetical protein
MAVVLRGSPTEDRPEILDKLAKCLDALADCLRALRGGRGHEEREAPTSHAANAIAPTAVEIRVVRAPLDEEQILEQLLRRLQELPPPAAGVDGDAPAVTDGKP